jgi:putative endonuclease
MTESECNRARTLGTARTDTTARGAAAESLAVDFLTGRGLAVLERNMRCKVGEIDLVCLDGAVLVMIEIRHRTRGDYGGALASVDATKRRKLVRSAAILLQRRREWRDRCVRFDVVGLQGEGSACRIAWIKDAFRAG